LTLDGTDTGIDKHLDRQGQSSGEAEGQGCHFEQTRKTPGTKTQ